MTTGAANGRPRAAAPRACRTSSQRSAAPRSSHRHSRRGRPHATCKAVDRRLQPHPRLLQAHGIARARRLTVRIVVALSRDAARNAFAGDRGASAPETCYSDAAVAALIVSATQRLPPDVLSDLAAALAAGVTIVTPNKRLARALVARHDAAMVRAGHRTWTAARALPWPAWLTTLWRDACDADAIAANPRLLAPVEAGYLWDRLVAADANARAPLLDPQGAATLAAEAWELVHAWGAGGESWRAWRGASDAPVDSDPAIFAAWAEQLSSRTRATGRDRSVHVAGRPGAGRARRAGLARPRSRAGRIHRALAAASSD